MKFILFLSLFLVFSTQASEQGCVFNGVVYTVGSIETMNQEDLNYRKKAGYEVLDGDAKLMMCSYLVEPHLYSSTETELDNRRYVWVAFSWAN